MYFISNYLQFVHNNWSSWWVRIYKITKTLLNILEYQMTYLQVIGGSCPSKMEDCFPLEIKMVFYDEVLMNYV